MTAEVFQNRLKFCRMQAEKWARISAVSLTANGERMPGQQTCIGWSLVAPYGAHERWKDVPEAKWLALTFAMESSEFGKDGWQDVFQTSWTMAMIQLWEGATAEMQKANFILLEREIVREGMESMQVVVHAGCGQ